MGEIRTVKGRERERATAAERAVVTPQRQKLLEKSMRRQPHNRRGMRGSGAFEAQHVRLTLQLRPPFRRTPGPTNTDRAHSCGGAVVVEFSSCSRQAPTRAAPSTGAFCIYFSGKRSR
jgi:hypothetical protein